MPGQESVKSPRYEESAGRRCKKRALLAVRHSLLVIIYHVLKNNVGYHDLGPDYFDTLDRSVCSVTWSNACKTSVSARPYRPRIPTTAPRNDCQRATNNRNSPLA